MGASNSTTAASNKIEFDKNKQADEKASEPQQEKITMQVSQDLVKELDQDTSASRGSPSEIAQAAYKQGVEDFRKHIRAQSSARKLRDMESLELEQGKIAAETVTRLEAKSHGGRVAPDVCLPERASLLECYTARTPSGEVWRCSDLVDAYTACASARSEAILAPTPDESK